METYEVIKEILEHSETFNMSNLISNGFIDILEPEIWDYKNDSNKIHDILERKDFNEEMVRASEGGCAVLRYFPSDKFIKEELGDDEWEVPILCVELFDYDDFNNNIDNIDKMEPLWRPVCGYNGDDYPQLKDALEIFVADCRSMMEDELQFYENMLKEKEISKE